MDKGIDIEANSKEYDIQDTEIHSYKSSEVIEVASSTGDQGFLGNLTTKIEINSSDLSNNLNPKTGDTNFWMYIWIILIIIGILLLLNRNKKGNKDDRENDIDDRRDR